MKILVTGGAGFIASHVSDRLLVARPPRGHRGQPVHRQAGEPARRAPAFYEIDIRDDRLWTRSSEAESPEVVIHHAAHIDVTDSVRKPGYDASVNILGSLNLLECCRDHGVAQGHLRQHRRRLFGEPSYLPVDEAHPIDPISPYGVSKHTVEHYLFAYRQNHGLDYVVLALPQRLRAPAGPARRGRRRGHLLAAAADRPAADHLRRRHARPATTATWPISSTRTCSPLTARSAASTIWGEASRSATSRSSRRSGRRSARRSAPVRRRPAGRGRAHRPGRLQGRDASWDGDGRWT